MGNQTDTVPIIFGIKRHGYSSSTPIISWTPGFLESVGIQHLTCIPIKELKPSDETWKNTAAVVELGQISSSFLALQSYSLHRGHEYTFEFQCYTNPYDLDLIDSIEISLDSAGGTWHTSAGIDWRYLHYAIHCCVRPTLRCWLNELPVEILEHIFSSFGHIDYSAFKIISQVCKLWEKTIIPFEGEPIKAKMKLARLKQSPIKRIKWTRFDYDQNDVIDFHELVQAVIQFQPHLTSIKIHRPSHDSALHDLLILTQVPTIKGITLDRWNFQEIFSFLQGRKHLRLNQLEINHMTEGNQEWTNVTPSNFESQFFRVRHLTIQLFDDSIHKILDCFKRNFLRSIDISYDPYDFQPLKRPIQLFGFKNLTTLYLSGQSERSNLVSFDFISTTCTISNLPKLQNLKLEYCFIDPTELPCLLLMPALEQITIMLFLRQKTAKNKQITNQMIKDINSSDIKVMCYIRYHNGEY